MTDLSENSSESEWSSDEDESDIITPMLVAKNTSGSKITVCGKLPESKERKRSYFDDYDPRASQYSEQRKQYNNRKYNAPKPMGTGVLCHSNMLLEGCINYEKRRECPNLVTYRNEKMRKLLLIIFRTTF